MKKIILFDPYTPKFTQDMVNWWLSHGYEVKVDRYYDPKMVDWADIIWFDTCDNNLASATKPDTALIEEGIRENGVPWAIQEHDLTNKKIIVRPIDIEVWQGHHAAAIWSPVTDCIFIAPHIRDMMMLDDRPRASEMKVHIIPCAVDLSRYTFKERKPGFKIGIVSEVWESKGVDYVLQIALKLKNIDSRYEIHWLGKFQDYHWDKAYMDDFISRNNLPIKFYDWVDSINDFLEDKDYLLHASKKEAFSYATAEAMAKGIKPILHHFYGADGLWPGITWDSIDEAVMMITGPNIEGTSSRYNSERYRQYLIDHGYTIDQMMNKIEEVING